MSKKSKKKKKNLVQPEFKQVIYDENGYRIGDDGYPMTRARRRMHGILNGILVGGYLCVIIAVVCCLAAYFQNQSITPTEFIYYGGNEFHGYSVGNLLRLEALFVFLIGLVAVMLSHRCFNWLYDDGSKSILTKFIIIIAFLGIGWNAFLVIFVGIADPLSLIMMILLVIMHMFMRDVEIESPTLKPSKPAQ
ncbi:MAG: hypothetical protein Q4C36_04640 [Coriobacteriia bacterium]|nr:hypothetical protein [Coriobacteriia bacterium]